MGTKVGRTNSNRGVQWYEGKMRDVPLALLTTHMHDMWTTRVFPEMDALSPTPRENARDVA
ncbi:hypothetical protein PGB90_000460 [Kerria lacca]